MKLTIRPVTPASVVLRDFSLRGGIGGTELYRNNGSKKETTQLEGKYKRMVSCLTKRLHAASAEKKD